MTNLDYIAEKLNGKVFEKGFIFRVYLNLQCIRGQKAYFDFDSVSVFDSPFNSTFRF